MSDALKTYDEWLAAFAAAVRHPWQIRYPREPFLDYDDDEQPLTAGGYGPMDSPCIMQKVRYLTRVWGSLEFDILVPQLCGDYRIVCCELPGRPVALACWGRPTLLGPDLDEEGVNLIDCLDGHEAVIGAVDDAMAADQLDSDQLKDYRDLELGVNVNLVALSYRAEGLILSLEVDYDAH